MTCAHVEARVRLCRGLRKAAKQTTWLVGTVFLSPAACTGWAHGNRRPDYACNSNSNYCGKINSATTRKTFSCAFPLSLLFRK